MPYRRHGGAGRESHSYRQVEKGAEIAQMKRKTYAVLSVTVMLILGICMAGRFILTRKEEDSQADYKIVLNEIPDMDMKIETLGEPDHEEPLQEGMEESQEPKDNSLADCFEGWTVEIRSDEGQVQKILEANREMIDDFFEKHPDPAFRWADFSKFDFTGDGEMEIIMSLTYVENYSGIISYNYVYDGQGNMMMKFMSGSIMGGTTIYKNEDSSMIYLCQSIHMGADHNVMLCEEITGPEEWDSHFVYIEQELGPGSAEEYYLYGDFSEEEEERLWQDYWNGIHKVCQEKEAKKDTKEWEQYIHLIEKLEPQKVECYVGCIY